MGSLGLNAGEQLLPLAQIKVGEEAEGGCGHGWVLKVLAVVFPHRWLI